MVLLTIFPYSRPLLSRRVPGRSPNAWLEGSECCHMSKLTAASSKYAEQGDWNHELRALAEGTYRGSVEKAIPWFLYLSPRLSGSQTERIFHPSVSATHAHRCGLILSESMENIPDCNGSHLVIVTPHLPSLSLLPSSHTGGIWNLLAAESHRAIKPSKAHKHTRVERQTMLARQAANRHNASWTWTNPSDRFLSYPSLRPALWTIPLSFSQTPPGSESRENFYIFTPTWKCYFCREG